MRRACTILAILAALSVQPLARAQQADDETSEEPRNEAVVPAKLPRRDQCPPAPKCPPAAKCPGGKCAPKAKCAPETTCAPVDECVEECVEPCEPAADCCERHSVCHAPTMLGDFLTLAIAPATGGNIVVPPGTNPYPIPVARGAFKIAENEAPRPQNRLFGFYNYYSQVDGPIPIDNVHRETIGFEKSIFDGNASIGVRQPFYQLDGGVNDSDLADVTGIFKYAVYNDTQSGDLVSMGVAVTAPSSRRATLITPNGNLVHPVLVQPFVGYFWGSGRFFVHGFTSVMVPTDSQDVIIGFTDLGIGYSLYSARRPTFISAVIPMFEVHVNTPLNENKAGSLLRYDDVVDLTGGADIILRQRFAIGMGACVPVTGSRPFDVEAILNFNWHF